jgi:hypothetical protein
VKDRSEIKVCCREVSRLRGYGTKGKGVVFARRRDFRKRELVYYTESKVMIAPAGVILLDYFTTFGHPSIISSHYVITHIL